MTHANTTRLTVLSFFFCVFCGLTLFSVPLASQAAPAITWYPASVSQVVEQGETVNIPISFRAGKDLMDATFLVVPKLAPYVSVKSRSVLAVAKGDTVAVTLTFSPSEDAPLGTFDGTVQLRSANTPKKTYSKPLPVKLKILEKKLVPPSDPQVVELGSGPDAIVINTLVYDGKVKLPRGSNLAFESLHVESGLFSGSSLSETGRFTTRMNAGSTGLLRVVDNVGNGYLMKVFPKAEELAEVNPIIDAKSTAIALLALQPGVITSDPYLDAVILAILARLPEVDNLADLIAQELRNGTFHFNRELSADLLNALWNASNALATISAQDLLSTNFSDTMTGILSSWFDNLIPHAFANITFDDPCTDLSSDHFKPTTGNRDNVCIGAEIDSVLRQGTFYMSNPRTRWVFVTTDTPYMSELFSIVDIIPARHFSYPNLLELLWDATLTAGDVVADIVLSIYNLDAQYEAPDKFKERMDKHFGPASSEALYNFPGDGEFVFNTVAFARNLENSDALYTLYAGSLLTTIFTEFAIPWVGVASDFDYFSSQHVDAEYGKRLLSCAAIHPDWVSDTVSEATRLLAGEATTQEILEWIAYDILFDGRGSRFFEYIACAAGPEASEWVSSLKGKISDVIGGPAAFVNVASAWLTAGSNTILLADTFFDDELASLDNYVAIVGSGPVVMPTFEEVLSRSVVTGNPVYEVDGYGFHRIDRFTNIGTTPIRLDQVLFLYLDPEDVGIPNMTRYNFPDVALAAEDLHPDFSFWGGYTIYESTGIPGEYDCSDPTDPFFTDISLYRIVCGDPERVDWSNNETSRYLGGIVLYPGEYIDIEHTLINDLDPVFFDDNTYLVIESEHVVGFKFYGITDGIGIGGM